MLRANSEPWEGYVNVGTVDYRQTLIEFQDHLAPRLDLYEQAIYLYILRHSRWVGQDEVTIGFKSARTRLALGVGTDGRPMSESSAYKKLQSLVDKGFMELQRTTHNGKLLRLRLPTEVPDCSPPSKLAVNAVDLETVDFFTVEDHRRLILERENNKCFYTLVSIP